MDVSFTQEHTSKVLVFLATYNEIENVKSLVNEIFGYAPCVDCMIVDDNSPDGTGRLLDEMVGEEKYDGKLKVIHRTRKLGLGTAHKFSMQYAIDGEYDVLITMDADFSHNPKYLPEFIKRIESYDFIIGSRYIKGGRCDYTGLRQLISRTANLCARNFLGIPLKECTTAYRAFNVDFLKRIDFHRIISSGYSFFIESLFIVINSGGRFYEIPIHFVERKKGSSKISKTEILKAILTICRLMLERLYWQRERRAMPL